jgi:large subunit ribosomal protein L21
MKYAIIESGGKQYKAVEGATIEVDRLQLAPGSSVKLEHVLLLADGESITVGTPIVKDTPVWTKIVEHFKGPKVVIFNYRPKKRIRVKTGHRQNYTRLLVEQIGGSTLIPRKEPAKAAEAEAEKPAKGEKPAKLKAETKESKAAALTTKGKAEKKPAKKPAKPAQKPARQEKKPAPTTQKGKAAPAKPAAKKPAAKKTATKKPTGKSSAK